LNSLLEDPRSLSFVEDTSQIFDFNVSISSKMCITATTTDSGYIDLSGPVRSRFTAIFAPPYNNSTDIDFVIQGICKQNNELIKSLSVMKQKLGQLHVSVGSSEFIRCAKSALALSSNGLNINDSDNLSSLSSIIDSLPLDYQKKVKNNLSSNSENDK
jgi:hypothetical protein